MAAVSSQYASPLPVRAISRECALLAFEVACDCIPGLHPAEHTLRAMAELAHTKADVRDAARAMRDAPTYGRVNAAFDLLRSRRGRFDEPVAAASPSPGPLESKASRIDLGRTFRVPALKGAKATRKGLRP